jgi:hypothetical protein
MQALQELDKCRKSFLATRQYRIRCPNIQLAAGRSCEQPCRIAHWPRLAPRVDYRVNGKFVANVLEPDAAKEP